MSAVEVEAPRPRPLSGGLWTLFSWLRRDEHSSSESLSSVGSDRTAASFAFLGPGHYATTNSNPLVIPPPGPPTDSYKKRVRDRNLRRHHDRDITLLRKYGLHGFDAFSLPSPRRVTAASGDLITDRDRRATSEALCRAHVPGKRRAPLPPTPSATSSLTRRRARKRPAPQPPFPIAKENKIINIRSNHPNTLAMNAQRVPDKQPLKQGDVTMGCKSEKYSKKESAIKEVKPRQDKSFLKQIFENRKRNSAIETSTVKLLPSISELDKQAHEIIERYKLKELEHNVQHEKQDNEAPGSSKQVEAWICTRCLRKYDGTVITCLYCLPLENALFNNLSKSSKVSSHATQTNNNSKKNGFEDKEKLKEILKEMKDSLPKHSTAGPSISKNNSLSEPKNGPTIEAATLRIGSSVTSVPIESKNVHTAETSSSIRKADINRQTRPIDPTKENILATIENVLITQPEVLAHTKNNIVVVNQTDSRKNDLTSAKPSNNIENKKVNNSNVTKTQLASQLLNGDKTSGINCNLKLDINSPMKISSLFNPIYIPKNTTNIVPVELPTKEKTEIKYTQSDAATPLTANKDNNDSVSLIPQLIPPISNILPVNFTKLEPKKEKDVMQQSPKENIVIVKKIVETLIAKTPESANAVILQSTSQQANIIEKLDQHSRRRHLINQLEQSIAKGDERAAAEAAVKLAQLRLSCSVLSFSSQIVAEASTSSSANCKTEGTPKSSEKKTESEKPVSASTRSVELAAKSLKDETNNSRSIATNDIIIDAKQEKNRIKAPLIEASAAVKPKTESVSNKNTNQKNYPTPICLNPVNAPFINKDTNVQINTNQTVPILVWVEDKETTRGPVQVHMLRNATMGDLRREAEKSLGLAVRMQRWIIGRALCSDDSTALVTLAGPELSAPFYLCLVESETKAGVFADKSNEETGNVYNDLVKLEQQAFVPNAEAFECGVCIEECAPGNGVVLRECVHSFCNECLSDVVRHSEEPVVSCPAMGCRGVLQEREIKGLVTAEDYEKWLARGLAVAESGTRNAFHCRTRDCTGWALCEPGVVRFPCPVCKHTNCVPCQAIHEGQTCIQHRDKQDAHAAANEATNQTDEGTRALLDSLIARGEALECPECSTVITKKWGCDWIKCSACKTEICWVTRGRRWGPAGRGDTSGGCRCGLDGNKCHPSCGYCH